MYRVDILNEGEVALTIHEPQINGNKVLDGTVTREVNAIDTFSFGIIPHNVGYGKLKPFKTKISVYNMRSKRYEFKGRILEPEQAMDRTGTLSTSFLCEGIAGYLHDSQQRHLEFRGSPLDLLTTIVEYHNNQVEDYKKVKIGSVTVTDPNDFIYIYLSAELTTWEAIQEKLVQRLGGEILVREEADGLYIDYVKEIGKQSDMEIRLAHNLVTNSKKVDATEIISRLTPLGERMESDDASNTDASEARLTIETVNAGLPYIDRPDLISEFGIQGGVEVWDAVTEPSNLLTKGRAFINSQKTILNQIRVSALDLSLIDLQYDAFQLGDYHRLINPIMGIDEPLRIIGMVILLDHPEANSLTIGDKFKTLAEYQRENRDSERTVQRLQNRVNAQVQRISTLSQQLTAAGNTISDIQTTIGSAGLEGLPGELGTITTQLQELQDSINNLDIPIYTVATTTSDGLMASMDKRKLDKVVTDTGLLSELLTIEKSSLVGAINELVGKITLLEGGTP